VFLQDYGREDYLDYQIIQVLIYVINEVFHRKLEQDHSLLSPELIEKKKQSKFEIFEFFFDQLRGEMPIQFSINGP
jgi:hypothetical protein